MNYEEKKALLGINGLGRIGKLTLWNQLVNNHFKGFVLNTGRTVGTGLESIIDSLTMDSTYGSLQTFLYGHGGKKLEVSIADRNKGEVFIAGKRIKFLTETRNPAELPWLEEGIKLVVDCTGVFLDPSADHKEPERSVRGHLAAGADVVVVSAPFKTRDPKPAPDSAMLVYGINHHNFVPGKHHVVSAASCTTTALSHMMNPLLENELTSRILTASMSTIHASTNTQSILDSVPKTGAKDLRKNRSVLENIIITSTGAARALEQVIPDVRSIGFMADSVRIPSKSVSLIILNATFRTGLNSDGTPCITRDTINGIYREASRGAQSGLLEYSEKQHVSCDLLGFESAAVIEGEQTHCRTGYIEIPESELRTLGFSAEKRLRMPVTHSKIFGWYDNEYGGYVTTMGKLLIYIDKSIN
ncbi:glyceraldehyde-3-phosphate dehydrogenase [Candidatus Fermentibacteria bacterium]|nr:MAG: glyceraldehyde-3-phosphate dehydrogenase [Candidatus Fermentibacteria bacterium]